MVVSQDFSLHPALVALILGDETICHMAHHEILETQWEMLLPGRTERNSVPCEQLLWFFQHTGNKMQFL